MVGMGMGDEVAELHNLKHRVEVLPARWRLRIAAIMGNDGLDAQTQIDMRAVYEQCIMDLEAAIRDE